MEGFGYINILWKCDQAFRASVPISWQTDWLKKIQRKGIKLYSVEASRIQLIEAVHL